MKSTSHVAVFTALFCLHFTNSSAQVGGPPIAPPNGPREAFQQVFVQESVARTQVLTSTYSLGTRRAHVFDLDASGQLLLDSSVTFRDSQIAIGMGDDVILARLNLHPNTIQIFERTTSGWTLASSLVGQGSMLNDFYGSGLALHGDLLLLGDPENDEVDVFDISTPGSPVQVDALPLPAGKVRTNIQFDGTTAVILAGLPQLEGMLDAEMLVYSRTSGSFAFQSTVQFAPGYDLDTVRGEFALTPGKLAVGFSEGTATDPCGRVVVLDRTGTAFVPGAEIIDGGICSATSNRSTGFGRTVAFRGPNDLLITGGGRAGATQYRRSAAGAWQQGPHHLADTSPAAYAFARDWVVGLFDLGLQVFDNVTSVATLVTVCPSVIPAIRDEWRLGYVGSHSLAGGGGQFSAFFHEFGGALAPTLMLVSPQRGFTPAGVAANLCLSGPIQRFPMQDFDVFGLIYSRFDFDPLGAGVSPGDTLLFQMWRQEPGIAGGATTNALAVTFIP